MGRDLDTYTLRAELIKNLIDVYSEVAPNCLTARLAYEMTVMHPARRFYITPKQAYQRINMYIKGKTEAIDSLKPLQRQLYKDLIATILSMQKHANYRNCGLMHLCRMAVLQKAPRFYITPKWFNAILYMYTHDLLDEHGRDVRMIERAHKEGYNSWILNYNKKKKYIK